MTGLRERKHEQTRQALIGALRDGVMAAHSLDDVTVDAISDAADVSARTFFRYFDTKADCALAACGLGRDVWRLPLDDALLMDVDARLLFALVRGTPGFLGLTFERLTGGQRPRFADAGALLDRVLSPEHLGIGAGSALVSRGAS
jgi:AcrR family transcriptional regulator